ncbi:MAG TPA: hypothetical protein V6D08_19305 [Candidatus Obscuribacterales bacterium]
MPGEMQERSDKDLKPFLLVVEESELDTEFTLGDEHAEEMGPAWENDAYRRSYEQRLTKLREFQERLRQWIIEHGLSDEVKYVEVPEVPVPSVSLLCTPASAIRIETMPGVKAVLEER